MKYILIFLLLISYLNAEEKKQKFTIGLGPYIQTQPYENVNDILLPSPVMFFDNGLFYIRWSRAGMYFLGEKNDDYAWGLSLTVQPRTYGYDASEIPGMETRETTFEGGLAFSAKIDHAYLETMLLTDMLDRYDSWISKTEIGYDFEIGNFSLYPSVIVIYQSSDFLNYYYGVTEKEASRTSFNEYIVGDGVLVGAQTFIKYPFNDKLSALINMRVDKISNAATNSPLVHEDYIYSGLLSLIYTFEY